MQCATKLRFCKSKPNFLNYLPKNFTSPYKEPKVLFGELQSRSEVLREAAQICRATAAPADVPAM